MPDISIIIPVYKAEAFLRRCVDSILNQTFQDFEVILVDDGSPDLCGEICDNYKEKDDRIKVIHQSNRGAAAARNIGIRAAVGKYIMFCDSDDVVSPMWIERLICYMDDEDTLPIGAHCSSKELLGEFKDLEIMQGVKIERFNYFIYNQKGIAGFLWNALYRRDIILSNNIMMRERKQSGDYNEDLIFALTYVSKIKNIVYTGYADYLYDSHENSLSNTYQQYYFEKYQEKYLLWKKFINDENMIDRADLQAQLATTMLYHFLKAVQMEVDNIKLPLYFKCYRKFKDIVESKTLEDCLAYADSSRENTFIINCIHKKQVKRLWMFYLLVKMKGR